MGGQRRKYGFFQQNNWPDNRSADVGLVAVGTKYFLKKSTFAAVPVSFALPNKTITAGPIDQSICAAIMKTLPAICLALLPFCAIFSQNEPNLAEKGAITLASAPAGPVNPTVRALIVGVSDYENEGIKDLRFSDRDAQVFHDFLRSKAGGEVPEENIFLRKNSAATNGTILDDLHFLTLNSKKDDLVIIYFSGHGDVEKQTLWQLGYLLCHDTPFGNYPNNAIELEFLNKIVTTLSVGVQAKVIVILDACRSGKLAGAENLGPTLTAKQAAIQKANEVRILSCQADQLSIESERWGGGRGVFSFFLINGLKGLADEEGDQNVLFYELKNFLRSNMRKAIQESGLNNEQTAVFVGQDEYFKLATIDPPTLAAARMEHEQPAPVGSVVGTAGTREVYFGEKMGPEASGSLKMAAMDAFSKVLGKKLADGAVYFSNSQTDFDKIIAPILRDFEQKESLKNFDEATQNGIADFVEISKKAQSDPALCALFSQKIAVRLHDLAQKAINQYLDGDAGELARRYYVNQAKILEQYPLMLKTAMELLPESHPLREICRLKYHYFNGVCIRLRGQLAGGDLTAQLDSAMNEQLFAQKLDPHAAYIQNELGILWTMKNEPARARDFFKIAVDLAPSWAIARSNLAGLQLELGQLDSAKTNIEKAVRLKPDYFGSFINKSAIFQKENNLLAAETALREAKTVNNAHYLPFEKLAFLLLKSTRYDEAELRFQEADERRAGMIPVPTVLPHILANGISVDGAPFKKDIEWNYLLIENPKTAADFYNNGMFYLGKKDLRRAEFCFNTALKIDANHFEANDELGKILFDQKRWGEAEIIFLKLIELTPEKNDYQFKLAEIYRIWGRPEEEEELYLDIIDEHETNLDFQNALEKLANLLDKQGRFNEEEWALLRWRNEIPEDNGPDMAAFYRRMCDRFPNNPDWLYKLADETWSIAKYEKVIEMDTGYAARAYIENLIGEHYFSKAESLPKKEQDHAWLEFLATATRHFEQSIARAPGELLPKFNLISAYLLNFQYEKALKLLENVADSNRLDFENLLKLADLRSRAGRFAEADTLLKKAVYWQPQLVVGLPELLGESQLLQGNHAAALDFYQKEFLLDPVAEQPNICYTIARLNARLGKKKEAIDWLQAAIKSGFNKKLVIKYDPDWDALRKDERFLGVLKNGRVGP